MRTKCFRLAASAVLLVSALLRAQGPPQSVVGTLNIVWGDPHGESTAGRTIYTLDAPDPSTLPPGLARQGRVRLRMNGLENLAVHYFGKRVAVNGVVFTDLPANAAAEFEVRSIGPAGKLQARDIHAAAVFGTRKVIFLLVKFSDDTSVPHSPTFYTDMTNPTTPPAGEVYPATINGFFTKTSWNQFSWVGDVGGAGGVGASGGWLTLPHPKSYYAPCGWSSACAQLGTLGDDATALGRAEGIVFTNYANINFVLSNDLDCCAWGGGYYSSVDSKQYGATWEPPWGQETGTYSHEMGHSLGLPHSGWVYYAYDSPWDMMSARSSANTVLCGSYFSRNDNQTDNIGCTEPGDGYIAPYKDYLGWIPAANKTTSSTSSSTTVTLEADALPLSTAIKMLRICIPSVACTGSTAHYFTVEARVKGLGSTSQYDNGLPGEGIIIHDFLGNRAAISGTCFFNNQSGWALPIDSTPGDYDSVACNSGGRSYPNYALYNAQWVAGQTYVNSTYGFSVSVVSRSGSTFVVSVVGSGKKRQGQMVSQ